MDRRYVAKGNRCPCVWLVLLACHASQVGLWGGAQFSSKNYEVDENAKEIELSFSLDADTQRRTGVHFSTVNGTAESSVDFLPVGGLAELSTSHPNGTVTIPIIDDPWIDGAKEFSVRLFGVGQTQERVLLDEAQVIIHDNEKRLVLDPAYRAANPGFVAFAAQKDGRLLGGVNGRPVRVNLDGTIDDSFAADFETHPSENTYETISSIVVQADGRLLFAGTRERFVGFNSSLVVWIRRYESDGTPDPTFDTIHNQLYGLTSMVSTPDGGVVVSGRSRDSTLGRLQMRLVRLRADGSRDREFVTTHILPLESGSIDNLAVRDEGAILIGGSFSLVYGQEIHGLAQLNADGTVDDSFHPDLPRGTTLYSMVLQSDGKLIFCAHDPEQGNYVTRLRADGSRDLEFFVSDFGSMNGRMELRMDEERHLLYVAGDYQRVNGRIWHQLLRLDSSNGALDFGFGDSETFSAKTVTGLVLLPNGGLH